MRTLTIAVTILALGAIAGGAGYYALPHEAGGVFGQPTPAPASPPAAQPDKPQTVDIDSLPPGQRLGIRANFVQRQLTVMQTLVLVPDEASYLAAISAWRTEAKGAVRFPVLIDDGTFASQRRIMRFVRAFAPDAVVRWKTDDPKSLPAEIEAKKAAIENAAAAAWGAPSPAGVRARWKASKFEPPGAVVAWPEDPAWTAALALAAGRGEPILWVKPLHTNPSSDLGVTLADQTSASIIAALDATGYSYNKLGDTIDALAICLNLPVKVSLAPGDKRTMLATTDVLGREAHEPRKERWAYASQIFGDAPSAAYDAMCALFTVPDRAWLFDGYDSSQPWVLWDMTKTGENLSAIGIRSSIDDGPGGAGLSSLQMRGAGVRMGEETKVTAPGMGVDAGLIAFNTSGNADFFDLKPGQAKPIDIPILRRPAMVHFVHSWSANAPTQRNTVGGVWMERGAYAYLGSVHEPYLQAFAPTPTFAARLVAGYAWCAAGRMDDGPAWKVALIGDPLITIGPSGPRIEAAPPLKGMDDVNESIPALLKARKFSDAVRALALVGRDTDAARLVGGLARDDAKSLTTEAAIAGISSCFAAGDYPAFLAAAKAALPALADEKRVEQEGLAEIRDMVWHAVWPGMTRATGEEADLLAACLRPEVLVRDTTDATNAMRRARGDGAARFVLEKARLLVKDRATSDQLDKLAK